MNAESDRAELIRWWDAIDLIHDLEDRFSADGWRRQEYCGRQDIGEGLRIARECSHADAQWLAGLFPASKPVPTQEEMRFVFLGLKGDARADFFASATSPFFHRFQGFVRDVELDRSAASGYAPALAALADRDRASFWRWANLAAAQGHRRGLFLVGQCCRSGIDGCPIDHARYSELTKEAAELGDAEAQFEHGQCAFGEDEWQRYFWWRRARARGFKLTYWHLGEPAQKQMRRFDNGARSGRVIYEIGATCQVIHVPRKVEERQRDWITSIDRTLALYDKWHAAVWRALNCWIWIAIGKGVAKDMRRMIAWLVWEGREAWFVQKPNKWLVIRIGKK